MDQRSDFIRQDIESTRASLDDKLNSLEQKAREAVDLKHHVSERPWMMLGAAVAAGYVAGTLGGESHPGTTEYTTYEMYGSDSKPDQYQASQSKPAYQAGAQDQSSIKDTLSTYASGFLSQFDDEIDMLKTAAMTALTSFLRQSVQTYAPAVGSEMQKLVQQRGQEWMPKAQAGPQRSGSTTQPIPQQGSTSPAAQGHQTYGDTHERAFGENKTSF